MLFILCLGKDQDTASNSGWHDLLVGCDLWNSLNQEFILGTVLET